ncbi:alpha/beta family hydrolase [Bosea sp. NPDC055594]
MSVLRTKKNRPARGGWGGLGDERLTATEGRLRERLEPDPLKAQRHYAFANNMTNPIFLYLAGNSFPKDAHVEEALRLRLTARGASFFGQRQIFGMQLALETRKAMLNELSRTFRYRPVIAIGRSSGGRIATLAAFEGAPLTSVVALGYPFCAPGQPEDPARTGHLANIKTPVLILQGDMDCYLSRAEAEKRYQLSRQVQIVDVDTDHEFFITPEQWDVISEQIWRHALGQRSHLTCEAEHGS